MLRVDSRRPHRGVLELLVSGTLDADRIDVLDQALTAASSRHQAVWLNLSGVVGLDRDGLLALLEWSRNGARLTDCPPFVRRWIREERTS